MPIAGLSAEISRLRMTGVDPGRMDRRIKIVRRSAAKDPLTQATDPQAVATEHETWAIWSYGHARDDGEGDIDYGIEGAEALCHYSDSIRELAAGWFVITKESAGMVEWRVVGVQWPFGPKSYPLMQLERTSRAFAGDV